MIKWDDTQSPSTSSLSLGNCPQETWLYTQRPFQVFKKGNWQEPNQFCVETGQRDHGEDSETGRQADRRWDSWAEAGTADRMMGARTHQERWP